MRGVVTCKYIALLNNIVDPLDIRYAGTIIYLFCSTCRQTKKGRKSDDWLQTQQPWVDAWQTATDSILQEARPYDAGTYDTYLEWYVRHTRTRLTGAPRPDMQILATPNAWTWGWTHTVQHARTIRYVEHVVD